MKNTVLYLFFALILFLPCIVSAQSAFVVKRGVNISHWLSQSSRRGAERAAYFTEKDVQFIAAQGFDHIRLPVDEEQLWDENGKKHADAFKLMHAAFKWAQKANLKVILDLHILRSHHFNAEFDGKKISLWTDAKAQERFANIWRELSAECKKYPVDFLAYELMNEPVADDPEDWNKLVAKGIAVVREKEPARKIVVGSNRWQSPDTFDALKIPANDPHIILSFHFYTPMALTHYQASWTPLGKYTGPVSYPGEIIAAEELAKLDAQLQKDLAYTLGQWDRAKLAKLMEKPIRKAKETGLPLYCGEWGCYEKAPEAARLAWYADVRSILEENGIGWTIWDYKGGFGILAGNPPSPVAPLIEVLTGN